MNEAPVEEIDEGSAEVNIRKAANGYVISCYRYRKNSLEVAKDWDDAIKIAKKVIGA